MAGTVLNGCIYVIGGSDDFLREGLKTVEKYNPLTNDWQVVTPMRMGRGALGMYCMFVCMYRYACMYVCMYVPASKFS